MSKIEKKFNEKLLIIGIDINNNKLNNPIIFNYRSTERDLNISNNQEFLDEIEQYGDIESAMKKIKEIKFIETIIIASERLFHDFVILFNENLKDIYIIPKIIIFSQSKKQFSFPNHIKNKLFYTFFGVRSSIEEIKEFVDSQIKEKTIKTYQLPLQSPHPNDLIFKKILDKKDYELPMTYKILLDISQTRDEKFIKALEKYKNVPKYKSLINPIITIPDIPIEI